MDRHINLRTPASQDHSARRYQVQAANWRGLARCLRGGRGLLRGDGVTPAAGLDGGRVMVDCHGIPVAVTITGGNRHDITQLLPLPDAIPPIRGICGRPRRNPRRLFADRGHDFARYRRPLWKCGIKPVIGRYERCADLHKGLLDLACSIICLRRLRTSC